MTTPFHTKYLIVGAGIHGLSTAYHLAVELKSRRQGSGDDIVVVEVDPYGSESPQFIVDDSFAPHVGWASANWSRQRFVATTADCWNSFGFRATRQESCTQRPIVRFRGVNRGVNSVIPVKQFSQ